MPIKRFADFLYNNGQYKQYMELLVNSFNKATLDHLMCVDQGTEIKTVDFLILMLGLVSVGWDGTLYGMYSRESPINGNTNEPFW